MYLLLVFAHLLAASMALGAIVATDLRLLSKLSQDRIRIAPPNEFVARIVMLALLLLYVTGAAIVWMGVQTRPDYLSNPKLQAKILLVVLLTMNAFLLHRVTFPRLARGRRVAKWRAADWLVVAVPVALSNFLWMFAAFLGIARSWNYTMPLADILKLAGGLYLFAQCGVFVILAMAGRRVEPDKVGWADRLAHSLASVAGLGRPAEPAPRHASTRRSRPATSALSEPPASEPPLAAARPPLRLVDTKAGSLRRIAR